MTQLIALLRVFSYLSILTVGGGLAAFPEMKNLVVNVHQWLNFNQLIHLYSMGQVSPGPNMMMIVAIGERVAGIPGVLVVLVAFFGPTAVVAFLIGRLWTRLAKWPWRASIERGLTPVSIGLLLAGCLSFARGAVTDWGTAVIAAIVFLVLLLSKINPAWLVLAAAIVGGLAFGPKIV